MDGVSLALKSGEVVGLLGPNGAGKTTVMRMLATLSVADSGVITVADALRAADGAYQQQIGFLPETVPLYEDLSVYQYLAYFAKLYSLPEASKRIEAVLEDVDLLSRKESLVSNLSKGMRQRLGLARAILPDPAILLLDEPTIGLDPAQVVDIRRLIRRLGKTKAVLFSTHILAEAQQTCDRLIILKEGKVVADGPVVELANKLQVDTVVNIELAEASKFVAFLAQTDWCKEHQSIEINTFRVTLAPETAPSMVLDTIIKNGFVVNQFALEQTDLEDIYLDLLTA